MSDKALQEQLIKRIASRLEEGQSGYKHVTYGAMLTIVAAECIRQMEWARRTATGYEQDYVVHGGLRYDFPTLTLPPDDWRPE